MAQMKLIPADNMKDKLWGKRGTPEREAGQGVSLQSPLHSKGY